MKQITIVRHAKAAPPAPPQEDFDRPLVKKGHKQLIRMAPIVGSALSTPDRIVASPAVRARQTAELLLKATGITRPLLLEERIYAATTATLLDILREQPETAQHVVLIGHNPGLEMCVSGLCSGHDARLNLRLPTAGVAAIELEVAHWRQVRWGCGILRLLISPRTMKHMK